MQRHKNLGTVYGRTIFRRLQRPLPLRIEPPWEAFAKRAGRQLGCLLHWGSEERVGENAAPDLIKKQNASTSVT